MANSTGGPRTWFTNTSALDMRAFDIERLANGQFLMAFGGSSSTNAALHTAILDVDAGRLGTIDTTTWAPTNFAGTVRRIDISAGNGDDALITLHSTFSSAGGDNDTNFSLVTLGTNGGTQRNTDPLPVNPGAPAENTYDVFSTVHLAGGGHVVFFTEPGSNGFADLSNGIRMARFDELGRRVGTTKTVIDETIVNELLNLEDNPEQPSAVLLGNGNIGLYYKTNLGNGFPQFRFQELTPNGALVGTATDVVDGAIRPLLATLDNGNQLATWFDVTAGKHKGRILDADGDLVGTAFTISTGEQQPYSIGSVIALKNGFAYSWFDATNTVWMGQLFAMDGKARSNPFLVTDTAGDFNHVGAVGGLERDGNGFFGYILGVKPGSFTTVLEGQSFTSESTIGINRKGGGASETINGAGKDDRISLGAGNDRSDAGGGNDVQTGAKGKDTLAGGAGFDRIDGGEGDDKIDGGAGTDFLIGGVGNDKIIGGAGSDRLTGGMGKDTVTGGDGADLFIFSGPTDKMTTVTDYNSAEGDKLKLLVMEYGFLGFFGPAIGTESNPTSAGLYFNTRTHILSNDRDGAGTLYERVNIAYLPGVDTLTINDILTF